jgi:FAD synthetase
MEVLAFRDSVAQSDPALHAAIVRAMGVISKALHVFPGAETCFSFNGGKDSTVVFHLIRAVAAERELMRAGRDGDASAPQAASEGPSPSPPSPSPSPTPSSPLGGLRLVYFHAPRNFPAVLTFMEETERLYGAPIERLGGFHEGLSSLLRQGIRAVLMGTRRADPDGAGLEHFAPTSLNWPPCMRVSPALEWTYSQVWAFLRGCGLPYCALYDEGYTSLGSVDDSRPNPLLRVGGGGDVATSSSGASQPLPTPPPASFLPAWRLEDEDAERLSRVGGKDVRHVAARKRSCSSCGCVCGACAGAGHAKAASQPSPLPLVLPSASSSSSPTAAILVIGDEVLSGRVADANGPFLATALTARGVCVRTLLVIPDEVEAIAAAVSALSATHTVVITTGGLGPTHDDVTMEGVARAFSLPLSRDPGLAAFLVALEEAKGLVASSAEALPSPPRPNEHVLSMASVPAGADTTLLYADGTEVVAVVPSAEGGAAATTDLSMDTSALLARGYPLVRVRNVHIFPGVPTILRRKWRSFERLFSGPAVVTCELRAKGCGEAALAGCVEAFAASHPAVKVGSYPADEDPRGTAAGLTTRTTTSAPSSPKLEGGPGGVTPTSPTNDVVVTVTATGDGARGVASAGVRELGEALRGLGLVVELGKAAAE